MNRKCLAGRQTRRQFFDWPREPTEPIDNAADSFRHRPADRTAAPIGMKESAAAAPAPDSLFGELATVGDGEAFALPVARVTTDYQILRAIVAAVRHPHQMIDRRTVCPAQYAPGVIENRLFVGQRSLRKRNL